MTPNRKQRRALRYGLRIQRQAERAFLSVTQPIEDIRKNGRIRQPLRLHPAAQVIAEYYQASACYDIDQAMLANAY